MTVLEESYQANLGRSAAPILPQLEVESRGYDCREPHECPLCKQSDQTQVHRSEWGEAHVHCLRDDYIFQLPTVLPKEHLDSPPAPTPEPGARCG